MNLGLLVALLQCLYDDIRHCVSQDQISTVPPQPLTFSYDTDNTTAGLPRSSVCEGVVGELISVPESSTGVPPVIPLPAYDSTTISRTCTYNTTHANAPLSPVFSPAYTYDSPTPSCGGPGAPSPTTTDSTTASYAESPAISPSQHATYAPTTHSGVYYYGYRYYNPTLGRWVNRDPMGEWGGVNLYGFAFNAAMNRVDPDGRFVLPIVTTPPSFLPLPNPEQSEDPDIEHSCGPDITTFMELLLRDVSQKIF